MNLHPTASPGRATSALPGLIFLLLTSANAQAQTASSYFEPVPRLNFNTYSTAPGFKALAISDNDQSWGWSLGQSSLQEAETLAVQSCQKRIGYTQPCTLVFVGNYDLRGLSDEAEQEKRWEYVYSSASSNLSSAPQAFSLPVTGIAPGFRFVSGLWKQTGQGTDSPGSVIMNVNGMQCVGQVTRPKSLVERQQALEEEMAPFERQSGVRPLLAEIACQDKRLYHGGLLTLRSGDALAYLVDHESERWDLVLGNIARQAGNDPWTVKQTITALNDQINAL